MNQHTDTAVALKGAKGITPRVDFAAIHACGRAPVVPAIASNDAALLILGQEFEAAFAAEQALQMTDNGDAWDQAYAVTHSIVDRIEKMPATTLEGLRVKARCIQWCYGEDPVFQDAECETTDYRLAHQIVRALLGGKVLA